MTCFQDVHDVLRLHDFDATWPTGWAPSHGSQRNLIFSIRRPSEITLGGLKIPNVKLIFSLFYGFWLSPVDFTYRLSYKQLMLELFKCHIRNQHEILVKERGLLSWFKDVHDVLRLHDFDATWPTGKTPSHGSQRNLIFSIRRPSGITLGGLKIPNVKLFFRNFKI